MNAGGSAGGGLRSPGLLGPPVFTRDDRGREVQILRRVDPLERALPPQRLRRLSAGARFRYLATGSLRIGGTLLAAGAVALLFVMVCGGFLRGLGAPGVAVLAAVIAAVWAGRWLHHFTRGKPQREHDARFVAASRITGGRCGGCGYDLAALHRDNDGCTVCPECGAAWEIDEWLDDFPPFNAPRLHLAHRPAWLKDARDRTAPFLAGHSRAAVRRGLRSYIHEQTWRWHSDDLLRLMVLAFFVAMALLLGANAVDRTSLTVLLALVVSAVLIDRLVAVRSRAASVCAMNLVSSGVCACCCGPLRTRPARVDGARLCERCGAAWVPGAWILRDKAPFLRSFGLY